MSDKLNALQELAIPFPIPASFRHHARTYATQFFAPEAQKRVYFNTLAVLVSDAYLRLLGFETDLTNSSRWNASRRLWSEATELALLGLGTLECRSINVEQQMVTLPLESLCDRIGYLFVEITNSEKSAQLIGFLPALPPEALEETGIAIADLQSMDVLIDYLSQREATSIPPEPAREFTDKQITDLKRWLDSLYTAGWEPAMRNLGTATGKKKLQLTGQTFEIQLSVSRGDDELMLVRVIVQSESAALPKGMQVSVPDESEIYTETVQEIADMISIPLELSPGEKFWVEVRLGESFIREYFIV